MHRYYFHLRDGYRGYLDSEGVRLPNDDAAHEHARRVASELLKNRERKVRHWRIQVQIAGGRILFEVALITLDRTLSHLSPLHRKAMEEFSQRCYALGEAIAQARAIQVQARALVAKCRGRPYLAVEDGEGILSSL
jgi:hypothetical protein